MTKPRTRIYTVGHQQKFSGQPIPNNPLPALHYFSVVLINILHCRGVARGRGERVVVRFVFKFIVFTMNLFLETLWFLVLFFYYILEAIVLFFIPSRCRRKDVKDQTVLITGAGMCLCTTWAASFDYFRNRLIDDDDQF